MTVPSVGKKRTNFWFREKPDPSVDAKRCQESFENGFEAKQWVFY